MLMMMSSYLHPFNPAFIEPIFKDGQLSINSVIVHSLDLPKDVLNTKQFRYSHFLMHASSGDQLYSISLSTTPVETLLSSLLQFST